MSRSFTEEGRDLACCANARVWSSFTVKLIPKLCVIVNTCSIIKLTQSSEGSPQTVTGDGCVLFCLIQILHNFTSCVCISDVSCRPADWTSHIILSAFEQGTEPSPDPSMSRTVKDRRNMNWVRDDEELTHWLFHSSVHCFWSITW